MEDENEEYEEVEVSEYEEVLVDAEGDTEIVDDENGDFGDDDADFGADDDEFDDDGGGWDDDDENMNIDAVDEQQYIPISTADAENESSEEYELDKDGNLIVTVSPTSKSLERQRSLSKQKSVDNQCWKCSHCSATNKLSWTLTVEQFMHKCCICKQPTYTPATEVFESENWDEPSNDHWECDRCTLHNTIGRNVCSACSHPHAKVLQDEQSDDSTNGEGTFLRGDWSDDEKPSKMMMDGGGPAMNGGGGMFGRFGGMHGMDRFGNERGMFNGRRPGGVSSMGGRNGSSRRKQPKDTRPIIKKMENNLRNLLILGFIRKHSGALPSKFFDIFNNYYLAFDRWDWDELKSCWTTKRNELVTIKRCNKKENAIWKNMFGLNAISYDTKKAADSKSWAAANPGRYSWTLRVVDRMAIRKEKENGNGIEEVLSSESVAKDGTVQSRRSSASKHSADSPSEKRELQSFEVTNMDVIMGVVDVEQMPVKKTLSDAFHLYACGYGMFAGNGKVYDRKADGWVRACRPIQHGDTLSVSIEWMKRTEFDSLYGGGDEEEDESMKEEQSNGASHLGDEWVVALSFARNTEDGEYQHPPKGSVACLPASTSYKLAVSAALRRWEIEWVKATWTESTQHLQMQQMMKREN